MKKILITTMTIVMTATPLINVSAGSGDAAAGAALGFMGGAMIAGAASRDSRRGRRAEEEARRAQEQTTQLRREQQKEKMVELQRELDKMQQRHGLQRSSTTVNVLIFTIILLFLGLIGLGIIVLKKKK